MNDVAIKKEIKNFLTTIMVVLVLLMSNLSVSAETVTLAVDSGSDEMQLENVNTAIVRVKNESKKMFPNIRGDYPRINVPASSIISIEVLFNGASPNEQIFLQADDGGSLIGLDSDGFVKVNKAKRVNFKYQISDHEGLYRISLYRGGERRFLQFWVGPEPPFVSKN